MLHPCLVTDTVLYDQAAHFAGCDGRIGQRIQDYLVQSLMAEQADERRKYRP